MENLYTSQISKTCSCCGKTKPAKDFSKNAQNPDGLAYYCRLCNAAKQREWKRNNKPKIAAWRKRYKEKETSSPTHHE